MTFSLSDETTHWLLQENNPSVRTFTLLNLLDKPEDDSEVLAWKRRIMSQGPIPKILSKLGENGHYVDEKTICKYGQEFANYGYLPKYKGTIWQLILFAELGADGDDERIKRTCEYVLKYCYHEDGLFTIVGFDTLAPCFQGNMLWALSKLGYVEDDRVQKGFEILYRYQRFDDGNFRTPKEWPYRGRKDRCSGAHSCYAGFKGLKAVTALPKDQWDDRVKEYVRRGAEFFLIHRLYKSSHNPAKLLHNNIDLITFPSFVYSDFLEILDVLLSLGIKDERMTDAAHLLKSKQQKNGRWSLARDVSNMYTKLETKGRESKWATYRALKALKKYYE